ncbi:terminase, partial [Escherichia coli]|nr:terminase [Escherichia coli]EEX1998124.1 terminase [Escherichia coli]
MTAAIQLYPYQQAWFLDRARFKIGMFARQTGKTFTTTLELVDDCFETEASGGRTRWVILSRGERQAKEAMVEGVKKHCSAYRMAAREVESYYRAESGERYTMLEVELPGGSRITAL